jgi:hypothetical protein
MSNNPWASKLGVKSTAAPETEVKVAVQQAMAEVKAQDEIVESHITPEVISAEDERVKDSNKLSRLVDDDFPFDESQLKAINGMSAQQFACMTGAAGTGKTTSTKKLVDKLMTQLQIDSVDMSGYWRKGNQADPEDDYEVPESLIPAIAMVGFTGRSAQMIKKNFPRDWHGNIMTIHRLLGFAPEYYDDWDDEISEYKQKMRFTPTYNSTLKLPWKIVIVDEAGMVGLDLWHQLLDALLPDCRVYMIGDINQLPPVHGRSIFGFAMAEWPSWELTHVHRQKGKNNPIVDNAWRVLKGQMPVSEGKFQMIQLKEGSDAASKHVRAIIPAIQGKGIYDPIRDTIITPINGNEGSRGYQLGQLPLNNEFALMFNPQSVNPRYIIDGGREKKMFAVGDKVMATKNDYEAGITNGMTGIITDITAHGGYSGDTRRFGTIEAVNAYLAEENEAVDQEDDFSLEDLHESMDAISEGKEQGKEKRDRGPSSHIVTVRFGDSEHGFDIPFQSLSEVGSLMTAYVVTCHKMQGGESPVVVIICHDSHKQMLYREWLYTAITRASQMCILLYTPTALKTALTKQNIKGTTLAQKVQSFIALNTDNGLGKALKVIIPKAHRLSEDEPLPEVPEDIEDADFEVAQEELESTLPVPQENQAVVAQDHGEAVPADQDDTIHVQEQPVERPKEFVVHHIVEHVHTYVPVKTKVAPTPKSKLDDMLKKIKEKEQPIGLERIPTALPAPLPKSDPYLWFEDYGDYVQKNYGNPQPDPEIVRLREALAKPKPKPPEPVAPKPVNAWAARLKKA